MQPDEVQTLKTLIVPNEKTPEGAIPKTGAGDGNKLQPLFKIIVQNLESTSDLIREIL